MIDLIVIPAKAGIQSTSVWIPIVMGMTIVLHRQREVRGKVADAKWRFVSVRFVSTVHIVQDAH